MAEYIERTEELMLAMNAGARAIENTKRYHGAVYTNIALSVRKHPEMRMRTTAPTAER